MRYIINQIVEAIEAEIHEAWTESDADFNRGMEYAVSIVRALDIRTDSDTISRQDAIAEFRDGRDVYDIMESIEELPSAPDSRQRGEWVWDEDAVDWGIGAWCCSECGSVPQTWWSVERYKNPLICAGSRFCGNCGADMRGGEDE